MTEIEILKEQVKALEKLLQLKDCIIQNLEKQIIIPFTSGYIQPVCNHEYPVNWIFSTPPNCIKCGQSRSNTSGWITISNNLT